MGTGSGNSLPLRRRPYLGPVAQRYFSPRSKARGSETEGGLRQRELDYATAFAAGYMAVAAALMSAGKGQLRKALIALAMDSVEKAGYRGKKYWRTHPHLKERDLRKQGLYLMNMPRIQNQLDKIYSRHGMSKDRMAACLAEIMEGKATTETRIYDGDGELTERRVQTVSARDRMQAIDMTIRATTGYAASHSRVQVAMETMYDADAWDNVPAIAVDPTLVLEGSEVERLPQGDSQEDEADDESSDEAESESDDEDADDEELDDDLEEEEEDEE